MHYTLSLRARQASRSGDIKCYCKEAWTEIGGITLNYTSPKVQVKRNPNRIRQHSYLLNLRVQHEYLLEVLQVPITVLAVVPFLGSHLKTCGIYLGLGEILLRQTNTLTVHHYQTTLVLVLVERQTSSSPFSGKWRRLARSLLGMRL